MIGSCCWLGADLLNVFEVFLPQLLLYPNALDPLNGDAASLMMKDRQQYEQKVKGKMFSYSAFHLLLLPHEQPHFIYLI